MLKHYPLILMLAATVCAAAPQFPAPQELITPSRWRSNSSGSMRMTKDEAEQALRIDVTFSPTVDKWVYPYFDLRRYETLNGATSLDFEICVIESKEEYQGCREGNAFVKGFIKYPPPKMPNIWYKVSIDLTQKDLSQIATFQLGLNPKNLQIAFLMKNIHFNGTPQAPQLDPAIVTDAPGNVFFQGDKPVLQMTTAVKGLSYTLLDWHGKTLQSGDWPQDGTEPLTLPALPNGYYIVNTTNKADVAIPSFNFTIIPHPSTRKYPHDSFFAVDSAQSWLAARGRFDCRWYDGDTYRLVSDLIAWAGFPHVRERLTWGGVNSKRDEFKYGVFMENADLLKERNVLISGMFHDAPGWTDNPQGIPRDLAGVFMSCKRLAKDFGDRMGDWEFWNEQDIGFSRAPVWDYTAAMKAACLGFKAGKPDIIAAPGAACAGVFTTYHRAMYLNDAAKYTDVMNYHTYAPPSNYAAIDTELHKFLADNGIPNRAIWFTECGTNLEGHSSQDGVMKNIKAHSPAQEMLHAEFYPKSQIYHMMQGVSRNYFFVFPPYNEAEGCKDWGTMRRDGSVKPAYAAMSTMMAHLVDAKLLGEIKLKDNLKAILFEQPDKSQVLVFWQLSYIDSRENPKAPETITIKLADGNYTLTDMLGTPSAVTATNGQITLTADRYPAYLSGIHGLVADIKPVPVGEIDRHLNQPADEDLTVIFRAELNDDDFVITGQKAVAEMPRTDGGRMKVIVWNLENTAKTGTIVTDGGEFSGIPKNVTIPPMGKTEFNVVFKPNLPEGVFESHIVFSGVFNGKKTTKLDIPVHFIGLFLQNCRQIPMDWSKPSDWEQNTSATSYKCVFDEAENALRFDVEWNNHVDRWFYPVHTLKQPEESFKDVQGIQFEVKTMQNKVENDFNCSYVMVAYNTPDDQTVRVINFSYPSPLTTWEVRRIMFDKTIPTDATVKFLRFGCNPRGTKMSYWLKNIKYLSAK